MSWHQDPLNAEHLNRLQRAVGDERRLFLFLGAGLSFGAPRQIGRASFDEEFWALARREDEEGPIGGLEIAWNDDELPLPSWPWLVSRMRRRLVARYAESDHESLFKFFRDEGPLDTAELFRRTVGEQNYREFLQDQFDFRRHEFIRPTPAHQALRDLDPSLIFTTNFDELVEETYIASSTELRVSISEEEFVANGMMRPQRHLVKIHGSIQDVRSIVLTRTDYAHSRRSRQEMFTALRGELTQASFLFVGFSLSDPNFNILLDDVRDSLGANAPVNYTVQARKDPVKERYLEALGVNTIWLDDWNRLPDLLRRLGTA